MSLPRSTSLSTVEAVTSPDGVQDEAERPPALTKRSAGSRFGAWTAPLSPVPIYIGITLTIAGFALLAYTWSRVAGTAVVALQLPFIASGGFGGLGLVVVGVLTIGLGAKRRDAWQRERRLEELAAILDRAGRDAGTGIEPSD